MKKILLVFTVSSLILISSCVDKIVKSCGAKCEDHGFCDVTTGTCDCDMGYEGTDCDVETRARFLGSYQVKQDSAGTIKNYTCIISNGPGSFGPYGITITALNGSSLDCRVSSNNTINVELGSGSFFNVSGSGSLSGSTINLSVVFDPSGSAPAYTMQYVLTK
jgi:hypothetical protein